MPTLYFTPLALETVAQTVSTDVAEHHRAVAAGRFEISLVGAGQGAGIGQAALCVGQRGDGAIVVDTADGGAVDQRADGTVGVVKAVARTAISAAGAAGAAAAGAAGQAAGNGERADGAAIGYSIAAVARVRAESASGRAAVAAGAADDGAGNGERGARGAVGDAVPVAPVAPVRPVITVSAWTAGAAMTIAARASAKPLNRTRRRLVIIMNIPH